MTDPLPEITPRQVFGAVSLPGKATAVGVEVSGTRPLGRPHWESLRGLVLALTEVGQYEKALEEISRYTNRIQAGDQGLREYVRWRAGLPISKKTALRLSDSIPDYIRYWGLEILAAQQHLPTEVPLTRVNEELQKNSEAVPLLLMLRADLVRLLGSVSEAKLLAIEGIAVVERDSRLNAVVSSHLGLARERARMLSAHL